MTAPRTPGPPSGNEPAVNAKALVLVGLAVLIGFVLLLKGFGQEGGLVESGSGTATTSTTTTTVAGGGTPDTSTTTTSVALRPPAQVSVLVANGSGASGAAAAKGAVLKGAGYTTVDTANAPAVVSKTSVYYAAGYEAEAGAVATTLGLPASSVAALPSPAPFDVRGANVVVVLGTS